MAAAAAAPAPAKRQKKAPAEPPAAAASPAGGAKPVKSTFKTQVVKGRAAVDGGNWRAHEFHVFESGPDVYDVLLNQTNITNNSNKFYIIQLLETDAAPRQYHLWSRWGRVGEAGQNAMVRHIDVVTSIYLSVYRYLTCCCIRVARLAM